DRGRRRRAGHPTVVRRADARGATAHRRPLHRVARPTLVARFARDLTPLERGQPSPEWAESSAAPHAARRSFDVAMASRTHAATPSEHELAPLGRPVPLTRRCVELLELGPCDESVLPGRKRGDLSSEVCVHGRRRYEAPETASETAAVWRELTPSERGQLSSK